MSDHERLDFESLPLEIRNEIYKCLLVKSLDERPMFDKQTDEDAILRQRFEILAIDPVYERGYGLHPAMLRTNKNIHCEAAEVVWGQNYFIWAIDGTQLRRIWHNISRHGVTKRKVSLHHSRLIRNIELKIHVDGDMDDSPSDIICWSMANVRHACKRLCLNVLQSLRVGF